MHKKLLWLVFFFQYFFSTIQAQENLELYGVVYSSMDSLPISYVHAGIPTQGIGVITNEVGAFRLNYPSEYLSDTFQVSHMGFGTLKAALTDLQTLDTVRIYLQPDIFQLSEIVVTPDPDSAKNILQEALKRLRENYPARMYQMNAFYREKTQNRDDYQFTRLMESMIDIQERGIQTDPKRIRIRLNEFRKSNDLARYSLGQKIRRKIFGEQNHLYSIMLQNPPRIHFHNNYENYQYSLSRFWLQDILRQSDASIWISGITTYNGQEIYILKFRYPSFFGDIYINRNNYGIHHVDYYYSMSPEHSLIDTANFSSRQNAKLKDFELVTNRMQFNGEYIEKVSIDYQQIQDKYYLSYIEWLDIGNMRKSNSQKRERTVSYNTCILMINAVQLEKKQMKRIKRRRMLDKDIDLNEVQMQYNQNFWNEYNILLATPLEQEVLKDLEFEMSLEDQFLENSKQ